MLESYNPVTAFGATPDFSVLSSQGKEVPTYQYGADNHNYGNGNFAITDPSSWGTGLDNAGKFIATAALSGANSFYNSAIAVGNWFGADAKENDTASWIASIDSNLGSYYEENKQSVDLGGFILSSLIPGMAGVKLLNAGQKALKAAQSSGMIGANLSRVTGLLVPEVQMYRTLAAADMAQSSATFSYISGNALKAVGAGYGQAALEAAAFETAVATTQFRSPVLSEADGWDIAKNIAIGTVAGGLIGGAITHATTGGAIKKAVKAFNPAEKMFADTTDVTGLSAGQRIIARANRLSNIPDVPGSQSILSGEFEAASSLLENLPPAERSVVAQGLESRLSRLRDETVNSLELKNRTDVHELFKVRGQEDLANQVADSLVGMNPNQVFANLESVTELGRMGVKLGAEKEIEKFNSAQVKNAAGILLDDLTGSPVLPPSKIGYIALHGETPGAISFNSPKVLNIADEVGGSAEVLKKVDSFKFSTKKEWDATATGLTHQEAEARYIWADKQVLENGVRIGEHDIPLLERAVGLKLDSIEVSSKLGNYTLGTADDIMKHLEVAKHDAALEILDARTATATPVSSEEIAKIVNTRTSFLEGELGNNAAKDIFARQSYKQEYAESLKSQGIWKQEKEDAFPLLPKYIKAAYSTDTLSGGDGMQLAGMAYLKAQQKLYQQGIDVAFNTHVPEELLPRFWHPDDSTLLGANRFGSGPGLFSFSNGNYGSIESWAEATGAATSAMEKHLKDLTSTKLSSALYKIASNQEVAVEVSAVNKTLQSTSELYGLAADGSGLRPLKLLDFEARVAKGEKNLASPVLQEGAPELIPFVNDGTKELWAARTELTSARTAAYQDVRNAQGLEDFKDVRAVRPVRPDPKDYPFYAIVVDPTLTGVGHKSMIHAASEKELEAMIARVPGKYETLKGDQLKQYFKAHGEYEHDLTLHENYIDADLRSKGVNNPFFVQTDPQKISQSFLQDSLRSDSIFSRELVNAKFEKEFRFFRQQGEQFTSTATSKYTGSYRDIENTANNPYTNYVKTALNLSQLSEHPYLSGLNSKLDIAASRIYNTIQEAGAAIKSPQELDSLNQMLSKYGVQSAYYDSATTLLANHTAPRGVLNQFVSRANAMISTLVTRLDPFNAINNAVGSTVLYGSELKSFMRSMEGADTDTAGKLAGLLRTPIASSSSLSAETAANTPQVLNAGKLIQNSIRNWMDPAATNSAGQNLKEFYKSNGWSTRLVDQHKEMMDSLTLIGTETAEVLSSKLNRAFGAFKTLAQKGEVITGNKYAEEFNRFVAADAMRQLTDVGVEAGKITSQESLGYINTFVNRTQGNILASQRPLMFQGAIGQAVGLFQSYQFNMMQQLFRHVAEGSKKDAALLLGLQGTMYGMNGLPAFNYLNTHIVGTLSGNPQHTDAYTATYGIAGKSVGDLLLYGLPSNLLRANLYTRGDINPRQVTVIPVNPVDIPFVSATMKMYDNVQSSLTNVANGGDLWQTLLQGIEHNGLSRPLAGLAQTTQSLGAGGKVFSTTNAGVISGTNELFFWATATRLAGAKPLDEAVANDATFRIAAYKAVDRERMQSLNKAVKSSVIGGVENVNLESQQLDSFASRYAAIGGKQGNFNRYMFEQIRDANTSKANAIMDHLKSPYAQKMQQIMGGSELMDGRSF